VDAGSARAVDRDEHRGLTGRGRIDGQVRVSVTSQASQRPLFAALVCGGCGRPFTANARTVPCFKGVPACRGCWDRVNGLRVRLGYGAWDRPDCYPSDYPQD
jgi:hypothetical protein